MRKLLFALILSLAPSVAFAQNTMCANKPPSDSSNACANTRFVQDAIANIPIPPPTNPGGTNGQIQYNNAGSFGGFTANGDVTINTTTGATTASSIRGVPVDPTSSSSGDILTYNGTTYVPSAFTSLVNAMCTASPSTCTSLFGYSYATWWGIACDGVTDDTAAINAAITALPAGSRLIFPATTCLISSSSNPSRPYSILIDKSLHMSFPNGGGLTTTVDAALIDIRSSKVTIDGAAGATFTGTASGSTTYSSWSKAITMNNDINSTTRRQNVTIRGIRFLYFKSTGVQLSFCDYCTIDNNQVYEMRYAGIMCVACQFSAVTSNVVQNIWSSTAPSVPPDPINRSDHYGITVTSWSPTATPSENVVVANNIVDNVPAWECYDTHHGRNISFVNNIGKNCMIGLSAGADATISMYGVIIANNRFMCTNVGSPVYSGQSPGTSITSTGIRVIGVSGVLATSVTIKGNVIENCGSSDDTLIGALGSIAVTYVSGLSIEGNVIYLGRNRGISVIGPVVGSMLNNSIVAFRTDVISGTPTLIDITVANNILTLGGLTASGSGYNGYNIVAQSGGTVGISRSNILDGVGTQYVGSSASNRVDLGATAP